MYQRRFDTAGGGVQCVHDWRAGVLGRLKWTLKQNQTPRHSEAKVRVNGRWNIERVCNTARRKYRVEHFQVFWNFCLWCFTPFVVLGSVNRTSSFSCIPLFVVILSPSLWNNGDNEPLLNSQYKDTSSSGTETERTLFPASYCLSVLRLLRCKIMIIINLPSMANRGCTPFGTPLHFHCGHSLPFLCPRETIHWCFSFYFFFPYHLVNH